MTNCNERAYENFSVPMNALAAYQKLYQKANQGFFRSRPSLFEIEDLIKKILQELELYHCSGLLCFAYEKWREYAKRRGRPIPKYEPQYFRLDCWDDRWNEEKIEFCYGDMLLCIYLLYYYIASVTVPERFSMILQKNAYAFCSNVDLYINGENPEKVFHQYLETIDRYMQKTALRDGPSNARDSEGGTAYSSDREEAVAGDPSDAAAKKISEKSDPKETENPVSDGRGEARQTGFGEPAEKEAPAASDRKTENASAEEAIPASDRKTAESGSSVGSTEAARSPEDRDSSARLAANAERAAILAKANAERDAILAQANAERDAILAKANTERDAILAQTNTERDALLKDARAEADQLRVSAAEIVRTCNMRRNLRLESYGQQHSALSENLAGVSKELQQMNQYMKNLRELNEAMRRTEALASSVSTQKAYDQLSGLYSLIADLRDYLRPENGVFAGAERENAYKNYETLLEIISDDLAEYGISTICSEAGTPFNGKYHQVRTDRLFSPSTARVRKSLRCGFLWGETVLQKETVLLNQEDSY